jgi:ABC-type transport system substrate-binding protein
MHPAFEVRALESTPPRFARLGTRLLLAGILALLFGCSGDDPFPGEKGMVLHIAVGQNVKGFDTTQVGDVYSHRAQALVYEELLQYKYLERPFQVEPCLAEAMPEVSEDQKTYTFKIRKGIPFHDNLCFDPAHKTPMTRDLVATDFVYSFKRIADQRNASTGWWLLDGRIEGLNEFRERSGGGEATDYDLDVSGLKAPDRTTFVVRLTKPYPQFLYIVTMTYLAAVPREAVEYWGEEILNHPVGTGPYRLKEWSRNHRLVFERNPAFAEGARPARDGVRDDPRRQFPIRGEAGDAEAGLLADAGKVLPFCDEIIMYEITEDQPLWLNFMKGRLDLSSIPKDNFASAVNIRTKELLPAMEKRGINLWTAPSLDVTYTGFNMEDPVVGDVGTAEERERNGKLRRAMSLAFDAETQIKILRNGRGIPAKGPIPPGLGGYDKDLVNPWRITDYPKALEKAKALMAEAGYPDGKGLAPLKAESIAGTTSRQYDEYFKNCMKNIGVRIETNANTWPGFMDKVKHKKAQIFSMAWLGDYPDAENFLQLFYSKNASPGANNSNYNNPEFDAIYEEARVMQHSPERSALYRDAAKIVIDDAPWIFGVHRVSFALQHGWLINYKPHDIAAGVQKYYRVDVERRKRQVGAWSRVRVLPLLLMAALACIPLLLILGKVLRTE